MAGKITSDPRVAKDTTVLLHEGRIVYAGPLIEAPLERPWDEMILNPVDEADFLDYAEGRLTGAIAAPN